MASIRPRPRADGSTAYTVTWRLGGNRDGAQQSETFDTRRAARDFKLDVEDARHEWPTGWVKGVGYVTVRGNTADEPEQPQAHPLLDFGYEFVRRRTGIGPDTRTLYVRHIERLARWLTPIVGQSPTVESLTRDDVRDLVNARERAGAAPKTIRNYHGLLFSVMEYAIERKLRESNPCRGTRLPEPADIDDDEQMVFLSEVEFDLIYRCLAEVDPVAADLAKVAVGTGLRFGEITALQVRDLGWGEPLRISVRRAWKHNGVGEFAIPEHGPRYLGKPKSRKSRRRLSAAPAVADVLRQYAVRKAPTDFVFTNADGSPIGEHFTDRRWAAGIELAVSRGLYKRPRFHDLRHTNAAWLISAGVPLPVIQRRLGHESITTTVDIYGGLLDQAHEAADAAIEAALVSRRVPTPGRRARLVHLARRRDYGSDAGVDDDVSLDRDDEARPEIDNDVA